MKRVRLYVFVVEAYLRDFMVAAKRIEREPLKLKKPTISPPDRSLEVGLRLPA